MTDELPIAGCRRARLRALAGTALGGLLLAWSLPVLAQDADENPPPAFEAGSKLLKQNANRRFGLDTGRNGLPSLRRPGQDLGSEASPGSDASDAGGISGGEGISRLPRFRPSGPPVSTLSGGVGAKPPSLLRQRAAPPRRYTIPTKAIVKERTQAFLQDLRLTPIVQRATSGLPQVTPFAVPLPTVIPSLGLLSPGGLLLGNGLRGPDEADPAYAPLGIKLGTFTVFPALTQSLGYDSNPDQTTPRAAKGSLISRTEGDLGYRSNWSSSEMSGELRGGYSAFPDNEPANRPNAVGVNRLRVDVNRDTRLEFDTRFLLDTQRTGSPDLGIVSKTRPLFATYGATLGVTEQFNRLFVAARGTVDRQVFEDAELTNGTRLVQSDRDANQYGVRLRAGYEISPVITPFVEGIYDTRVYDTPIDQSGFRRDSDGLGFLVGATFALTRFVSGEVSAGLQHRDYVDPRLRSITAPLMNTALIWQFSPLTTVRFNQQTGVIETSVPGAAGVETNAATIEVQHDLLRNLSITMGGAYLTSDYQGAPIREKGFSALARLDYRFNRWLTFRGSYIYQQIDSTAQSASFHGNVFLLGMRVNP